uniref:Uncharacterized protein n=1 Tax=Aegilops tauschii TaxID=37682 RepID=N1R4Y1_AEGTA
MEEAAPALRPLGLVGIFHEALRVARSHPPGSALLAGQVLVLTMSFLAHIAICPALFPHALASSNAGAGLLRLAANWAPFFLVEAAFHLAIPVQSFGATASVLFSLWAPFFLVEPAFPLAIAVQSFGATAFVVFSVRPRYGVRDDRAWRLVVTSFDAFLLLLGCTALFGTAAWCGVQLALVALLLLVGGVYFAGAGHIGSVWRVGSVMMVLEDAWGFRALCMSDELLLDARMFWAPSAVAVFTLTLVGCILAVQLAFSALVVHDVMGLGVWLRVAAGVVMTVALWAALMAGLVFFVCNSHHPESFVNVANVGRRL